MSNPESLLCLYCLKEKPVDQFSLEHVVPQFLGGAYLSDLFKSRNVCRTCNSNLGLFVDAGFEKSWIVNSHLTELAYDFFNPNSSDGLPLRCMGVTDLDIPGMSDDEICEMWLGPLGEQVFWVRPKDDRLYWYSGGNPVTAKSVRTRAYFVASERTTKNPALTWYAFRDAFHKRKVRKIMYTVWEGVNPKDIGFDEPNELDTEVIEYLANNCSGSQQSVQRKNQLSVNINFDQRFLAKLALGISHSYFERSVEDIGYDKELRNAIWKKPDDPDPEIYGCGMFTERDPLLRRITGTPNGVTTTLVSVPEGVTLHLNIRQQLEWTVLCAKRDQISAEQHQALSGGVCFLMFKPLHKAINLSLPRLVAHNLGNIQHPELAEIESLHGKHKNYFHEL